MPAKTPRRRVFFSFHYDRDNWRTSQVRNIGAIQGSKPVSANAWEEVKRRGKAAISAWIDARIARGSCVVVLVGSETADREWVRYEIEQAWVEGKGLVGIYIHNLLDRDGKQSRKGRNPFDVEVDGVRLSDHVKVHDPRAKDSQRAYRRIANNIEGWVEDAVGEAEERRRARREAAGRSWLSRLLGIR
ncbi:MAG: TIR domain-containing protein [Chloroflexi bacterium]|nr:TIR domain-containing protein [Chloroflexota bacterium]